MVNSGHRCLDCGHRYQKTGTRVVRGVVMVVMVVIGGILLQPARLCEGVAMIEMVLLIYLLKSIYDHYDHPDHANRIKGCNGHR